MSGTIQPCPECDAPMEFIEDEKLWRCPECGAEDVW